MNADDIKPILQNINSLQYKCILIDGKWGIGKTYAVKDALDGSNKRWAYASLFGAKDCESVYRDLCNEMIVGHKALKTIKKGIDIVSKAEKSVPSELSPIPDIASSVGAIVSSLYNEKRLLSDYCRKLRTEYIIVFDDLERISGAINITDVLGMIEHLKSFNAIKIIIIANSQEFDEKTRTSFERYKEKVIDRTLYVGSSPKNVIWENLGINDSFAALFQEKHNVKNLRTLKKAEEFYCDVLSINPVENNELIKDLREICYAIVVQSVEKIYEFKSGYETYINEQQRQLIVVKSNYLQNTCCSDAFLETLFNYYNSSQTIDDTVFKDELQYRDTIGERNLFYLSDKEMVSKLEELEKAIKITSEIKSAVSYIDDYVYYSSIINQEFNTALREFKNRFETLLIRDIQEGDDSSLFSIEAFWNIRTDEVRKAIKEIKERMKHKYVEEVVKVIVDETADVDRRYAYSKHLVDYLYNEERKQYLVAASDKIFTDKFLPLGYMSEEIDHINNNMCKIMNGIDSERFKKLCADSEASVDNMSKYRLEAYLERQKAR